MQSTPYLSHGGLGSPCCVSFHVQHICALHMVLPFCEVWFHPTPNYPVDVCMSRFHLAVGSPLGMDGCNPMHVSRGRHTYLAMEIHIACRTLWEWHTVIDYVSPSCLLANVEPILYSWVGHVHRHAFLFPVHSPILGLVYIMPHIHALCYTCPPHPLMMTCLGVGSIDGTFQGLSMFAPSTIATLFLGI